MARWQEIPTEARAQLRTAIREDDLVLNEAENGPKIEELRRKRLEAQLKGDWAAVSALIRRGMDEFGVQL
jgi:hypothetical protein